MGGSVTAVGTVGGRHRGGDALLGIAVASALLVACDRGRPAGSDAPVPEGPAVVTGDDDASAPSEPAVLPPPRADKAHAGWTVVRDAVGAIQIRNHHAEVIRAAYSFFESDYRWAEPRVTVTASGPKGAEATIEVPALGVRGRCKLTLAQSDTSATATLSWELTTTKALRNISGGGLDLTASLEPSLWDAEPKPEFSADNRRLSVGVGGDAMQLELSGDPAVIVPAGPPGVVRVVLLAGDVKPGTTKVSLTVTLPTGGRVGQPASARHEVASAAWPGNAMVHDGWPVDLSHLQDAPAGKHGPVRVVGESLEFEDGTPARFWGTNVTAYALFETDRAAIARQAKRLSAMGFNLVRLHHHDSGWVEPNIFDGQSRRLRRASLESLDWWIKCLADEGIYIWLDLHVGRVFREADGIGGFAELPRGDGRGFSYVNPRIGALMDEFARAYLDRPNVHTGRTIASDPAIAMVLLTNENDIDHHFGSLMLPGSGRPVHEALLRKRVEAFAARTKVSVEAALRVWEGGPAKLALADIEHQWGTAAIAKLRKLGVRAPIAVTNVWGDEGLYSVPALTAGDIIDVHSYGGPESLATNPHHEANFLAMAGLGAVLGKPHALSEFNVPPPAPDRYIGPMYVAAVSAFQGWDAPLLYAYTLEARRPTVPQEFSAWVDPSSMGLMPAAAILYRRQDVAPAKKRVVLAPPAAQVYGSIRHVANSAALRTGLEQSQVVIALPDAPELTWDRKPDLAREKAAGATIVTDLDQDLLPAEATTITADTAEFARDFIEGRWVLSTPRSQAASGWIGGTRIELGDGWVELDNPGATFVWTSLDDQPIASSARVLVTAVGASAPMPGRAEFRAAPIRGRFAIRSKTELELVPLANTTGSSGGKLDGRVGIAGKREGDLLVFEFDGRVATHWWILRPVSGRGR